FSPMRKAAAGGREMKALFKSYLHTQPGDVIVNPRNPVNLDSKPIFEIIFYLRPVGEKTRSIASLQWRILIISDLVVD
ncbi:MAG: hypothetical protein ACK469_09075, partial [Bacteroidota bacterium]